MLVVKVTGEYQKYASCIVACLRIETDIGYFGENSKVTFPEKLFDEKLEGASEAIVAVYKKKPCGKRNR